MIPLEFVILGEPKAKQSVKTTRSGIHYTVAQARAGQANVRAQIAAQLPKDFEMFDEPVEIQYASFEFALPKSAPKKLHAALASAGLIYKAKRPDLPDNLMKGLIDAMTGVVFRDDSLIVSVNHTQKIYSKKPKTVIRVSPIRQCYSY